MINKFKNVRKAMVEAEMNVKQVATEIGISKQAFYKKLNGKTKFSLSDMLSIRDTLNNHSNEKFTLEYLFGDDNDS